MIRTVNAITIPNVITALRILMALGAAAMFMASFAEKFAAALCITAALLDAFDGWYARTFSQCSNLGKHMDPFADKIVIAVMYTVIAIEMSSALIWTLMGLIFFRELAVTLLRSYSFRRRHVYITSSKLGKVKMIVQSLVGCIIMAYAYFFAKGFSIPVYLVATTLLFIVTIAYFSAYQYIISLKQQRDISLKPSKTRFDKSCQEKLVIGE